jgi:hypothetical protein
MRRDGRVVPPGRVRVRPRQHQRVFDPPSLHAEAFDFIRSLTAHTTTLWLNPGRQHLRLLERLCADSDARGDLVSTQ